MALGAGAFILAAAFVTSVISGVFGMAGGILLMGALALVLPVSAAFVAHGFIQMMANGWRAVLHRRHIRWMTVSCYILGSAVSAVLAALVVLSPSEPFLYLMLAAVSALVWLPKKGLHLDASRPPDAVAAGLGVTGLNLIAGVAGPLLDVFFVRTNLTRHQIVATKAATQVFSHIAKISVYGLPLIVAGGAGLPPWPVFAMAGALSIAGTLIGARILDRMTDAGFLAWSKWIITGVGVLYLVRAIALWV